MATPRTGNRPYLPSSPFNAGREAANAKAEPIPVGAQVSHERHGLGKVIALDGARAVLVDFGNGDVRRVALDSARLERL